MSKADPKNAMAIFAGCAALKLTGRVDSRDTRIGLNAPE
jgi:hypothetical protein